MDTPTSIDSLEQWQLLRSVCPIFESDLTWRPSRSENVDAAVVEDTAKFLKIFIMEIKVQVRPDYVLSESTRPEFLRHINALLSTLETLVKSDILQISCNDKSTGKDTIESSAPIGLSERCPKLVALAKLVQSCKTPVYERYLHLVQDAVTFKQTRYELQRFVDEMQKTLYQDVPQVRDLSAIKSSERELKSRVNTTFSSYSRRLFDSLVTHLQPCSPEGPVHRAMLHLKGFTDMDEADKYPELSMLLACCPDQKTWQQMYCSMSSQTTNTNHQTEDICKLAQESYESRAILKVELNGDKVLDTSDLMFGEEPDYFGADPTLSLFDLLKLGLLKNPYRFYPNDKKILAYILAHALLSLYEGPWLQTLWTLENLMYRCHTNGSKRMIYDIHQPYISCVFLEQPPSTGTLDSKHRHPLILSFAKLLVELESGEEMETLVQSEKGGPGLLGALLHYCKTWSKHQLSQGYANALDACVMFQKYLREDQLKDPQITIQEVILRRIVHQLEMEIDLNQKKDWGSRHLEDHVTECQQHTQGSSRATLSVMVKPVSTTTSTTPEESTERTVQSNGDSGRPRDSGHILNAQGSPRLRPTNRDGFDIAIICALPLEADAVRALFDETYDEYGRNYEKIPGDANIYTTGRIDQHNIVLCHLPGVGTSSAASAASSLRGSYTQIRLALVVGICGAVPFPSRNEEIILGDIVISDSVIKYDSGRQYPDGFRRKPNVQEPPNREIRGLLQKLKTHETRSNFQKLTSQYLQDLQDIGGGWNHPGVASDILFEPNYLHKPYQHSPLSHCICSNCRVGSDLMCDEIRKKDCNSLGCVGAPIPRTRITERKIQPFVHIGKIASADTVMKSGEHRDKLAENEEVIGFEMEGAGIWDNIPCLVIKGVSDYADSHKNKRWQAYAAATAASGTRAFLKYWAPPSR